MGDGAVSGREGSPEDRAGLLRRISAEPLRWNPGAVRTTWIPSDEADVSGEGLDEAEETRLRLWLDLWDFFGRAAALHG